jgi:general stress protein 26
MDETAAKPVDLRRVAEAIKDIDICMFVTQTSDGVRGRPMSNNRKVEYDGDAWFFSYLESGKVSDIKENPRVALAYMATERGTWISIEGEAHIVRDDARKTELWDDELSAWFSNGPNDDALILLNVSAHRIHAWMDGQEADIAVRGA